MKPIEIFAPRWKGNPQDRIVYVRSWRLPKSGKMTVELTNAYEYNGIYELDVAAVKKCPTHMMDTKAGGKAKMYVVPIDWFVA